MQSQANCEIGKCVLIPHTHIHIDRQIQYQTCVCVNHPMLPVVVVVICSSFGCIHGGSAVRSGNDEFFRYS